MPSSLDPAQEQAASRFDSIAHEYDELHRKSISSSGESPAYFAHYKRRVLERVLGADRDGPVLDFGCGIGTLTAALTSGFSDVHAYDPSTRCLDVARREAPRASLYSDVTAIPTSHFRAVVLANVLHHVAPGDRERLLETAVRAMATGGCFVVFEHNPLNPLTRRAVAACPFDEGIALLWPRPTRALLRRAGVAQIHQRYIVFFPRRLRWFRPVEPFLGRLPLGAQVVTWGIKT